MKTIRKISENPFMLAFMASLVLFVGCAKDDINSSNLENSSVLSQKNISGEDLFKSIIFADGPLTQHIDQLNSINDHVNQFSDEDLEQYRLTQAKVIEYINNNDQNFFTDFKKNISSGEPILISDALSSGIQKVKAYTKIELQKENINLESELRHFNNADLDLSDFDNATMGVGIWLIVTVVVALFIVINVNVNETINVDMYEDDIRIASIGGGLQHHQLVIDLTKLE